MIELPEEKNTHLLQSRTQKEYRDTVVEKTIATGTFASSTCRIIEKKKSMQNTNIINSFEYWLQREQGLNLEQTVEVFQILKVNIFPEQRGAKIHSYRRNQGLKYIKQHD